jgi:hypothetical protein
MFCQNWKIIYLQQVLTYGCPRGHIIFLFLWLIFKSIIGSLNKWLLGYLKQQHLLIKPWLPTWSIWIEKNSIAYVKNEGLNLTTMTTTLKSIVKCEVLGLDESFQGTCFGHVFSRHVSMLQLMKSCAKTFWFISIKFSHICRIYNLA